MSKSYYATILHPNVPKELVTSLVSYVLQAKELQYLLCIGPVDLSGNFATMRIVGKKNKDGWDIQIPIPFVMMVCKITDQKSGMGFVVPT